MSKLEVHAGDFKKSNLHRIKDDKFSMFQDFLKRENIALSQIDTIEHANEENVKRIGGAAGWGVAGAALLGPVGLLAGLLGGGRGKDITFVCKFKDGRKFMGTTDSKTYTKLQASQL